MSPSDPPRSADLGAVTPGEPAAFRSSRCRLLERNRRAALIGVVTAMVCVLGAVLVWRLSPALLGLPILGAVISLVAASSIWHYRYLARRREGELVASAQGIRFDGRLRYRRDELARAVLAQQADGLPRVLLCDRVGRWLGEIEVPTVAEGRSLLAAARLDTQHAVGAYRLNSHWFGRTWFVVMLGWVPLCVGALVVLASDSLARSLGFQEGSVGHIATFWLLAALFALGVMMLVRRSRLVALVGPDGVYLRGLGRNEFVRYRDVARVQPWAGQQTRVGTSLPEGFSLVLYDGRHLRLRTLAQTMTLGRMRTDVVAEHVNVAMGHGRSPSTPSLEVPEIAPGQAASWVEQLRRSGLASLSSYRAGAVPVDVLWRKLADPAAEPHERAASAIVLCAPGDESTMDRVRAEAAAVARPELRAALDAAASGNDPALYRALEQLARSCA